MWLIKGSGKYGDGSNRGNRGGAYNYYQTLLSSSYRANLGPGSENSGLGFRVASGDYQIPEPATLLLLGLGAVMLRRKR